MPTLLQDQVEYSIKRVKHLEQTNLSETLRKEREILALLLIADDIHAIRGLIESLVLALSDLQTR